MLFYQITYKVSQTKLAVLSQQRTDVENIIHCTENTCPSSKYMPKIHSTPYVMLNFIKFTGLNVPSKLITSIKRKKYGISAMQLGPLFERYRPRKSGKLSCTIWYVIGIC